MQAPSNSSGLELVGEYAGKFRSWRWKNVVFFGWATSICTPGAEAYATLMDSLSKSTRPGKLSAIHLVAKNLTLPELEPRAIVTEVLRVHGEQLACVGAVVEGTGFWLSAMRSFTTGLLALSARPFEMRMHGELDELLAWFPQAHKRRTGVELGSAELRQHLETARAWCQHGAAAHDPRDPAP